jgi:uncharacterized protein
MRDMARKRNKHQEGKQETVVSIRVTPRSSRNEVSEVLDDGRIKIRLTAPPTEGKANIALVKFVAEILGVADCQITIKKGHTSREKLVSIQNIDEKLLYQRIIGSIKSARK